MDRGGQPESPYGRKGRLLSTTTGTQSVCSAFHHFQCIQLIEAGWMLFSAEIPNLPGPTLQGAGINLLAAAFFAPLLSSHLFFTLSRRAGLLRQMHSSLANCQEAKKRVPNSRRSD